MHSNYACNDVLLSATYILGTHIEKKILEVIYKYIANTLTSKSVEITSVYRLLRWLAFLRQLIWPCGTKPSIPSKGNSRGLKPYIHSILYSHGHAGACRVEHARGGHVCTYMRFQSLLPPLLSIVQHCTAGWSLRTGLAMSYK